MAGVAVAGNTVMVADGPGCGTPSARTVRDGAGEGVMSIPAAVNFTVRVTIPGTVPDPTRTPSGCPFHPRCPIGDRYCVENVPQLKELRPGHTVSCWKAKAEGTMPFERRLTVPVTPVVEGQG